MANHDWLEKGLLRFRGHRNRTLADLLPSPSVSSAVPGHLSEVLQELLLRPLSRHLLGGSLGHFIFSLTGLKRILFTNIFQRL